MTLILMLDRCGMASSDDEQETLPYSVTGYYFLDDSDSPVSFEVLPIQFDDAGEPDACDIQVFLHGSADGGLQKICKQVIAWKLQLQGQLPEVYVLSKDNLWIKLQKARKSYEESVRTTLVTIQVLHYLRKNPETSEKILWDHLRKKFRLTRAASLFSNVYLEFVILLEIFDIRLIMQCFRCQTFRR